MISSSVLGSGFANVPLLCFVFLAVSGTSLANSILAFAPVTALASLEGLNARHLAGACPAFTQTACGDGLGCCPIGAACTYSRDVPVCDESCNGGPNCPNGGCCQAGYVCGSTNNFCTPAPNPAHTKAPAPSPSASNKQDGDDKNRVEDETSVTATSDAPNTPPSAPLHANPTPIGEEEDINPLPTSGGESVSNTFPRPSTPTKTPSPTATASHGATSTTTSGTRYVAGKTPSGKSGRPSAQATSTGAAYAVDAYDSLMTVVLFWIAGLAVMF